MGNINWSQIIPVLLVVGLSAMSWIFNQLQKQAQKKAQEDRRRKYEEDMLRQGKPIDQTPGAEVIEARDSREALRRAQLEELRRRARGKSGDRAARQGPIILIPGSTGPIVIQPGARPRPQGPARGTPVARPPTLPSAKPNITPQQRAELKRRQAQQRAAEATRKQPKPKPKVTPAPPPEPVHRTVPDVLSEVTAERASDLVPLVGTGLNAMDWRRAIVARELLSPPLALRDGPASLPF
jgi:hypothetical protein